MAEQPQAPAARNTTLPQRVVLRVPGTGVLAALALAVCVAPVALAAPPLLVLFLLPIGAGFWVLRNRTTVDGERIVARATFRSHTVPWTAVRSLRVTERSWLRAVLTDDREITLPAVRLRHVPILAAVSGGRLADPSTAAETEPAETAEPAEPAEPAESAAAGPGNAPEPAAPPEPAETPDATKRATE